MADVRNSSQGFLGMGSESAIIAAVLGVVLMIIIPLPTAFLDTFMALNLFFSVLILLLVLFNANPLEFSMFPTMLLISTIFGLALNVSSTRLILSKGENFDGRIVRAFSEFVIGTGGTSGIVIGFIMFIIFIVVQFLVITKGATRVAEVAARFALDALPGKQMAIDAEFSSGAITEEEARKRKSDLQRTVDFYGAMDGSSKFVSGNVQVSIVITIVNILGGLIIGVTIHGEPIANALGTYTSLTVGDGLVSQIPSFLISVATGLIVTRANSNANFGSDVINQFSRQGQIYFVAAAFLFIMGLLPGFPKVILFSLAALSGWLGYSLTRREQRTADKQAENEKTEEQTEQSAEISPVVPLDPLSLELGFGLIPLVDKDQGAELLDRITRIRKESALELGLVVPRIRIMDNMKLEPAEYCFKIKGVEVGRGAIRLNHFMAINPGGARDELSGESTIDPAFGLPAQWITEDQRERAERSGYTVVDPPSIIATHLTEVIKKHAAEILGRQEVKAMLDTLKEDFPAVVEEVNKIFTLGEIQKVFQNLLKEQVSIRNLVVILETLGDYGNITKDRGFLTEKVRQALGRQICLQHVDEENMLPVLTIYPELEQIIINSRVERAEGDIAALDPELHKKWINATANGLQSSQSQGIYPVLLCSEAARPLVKNSLEREFPDLSIISVPELADGVKASSVGEIRVE